MNNNQNEVNALVNEIKDEIELHKKLGTDINEMYMTEEDKVYQQVVDGIKLDASLEKFEKEMLDKRIQNLKSGLPQDNEFEDYKKLFVKHAERKYAEKGLVMTEKQRDSAGLIAREQFDKSKAEYQKLTEVTRIFDKMVHLARNDEKAKINPQWNELRKMADDIDLKNSNILSKGDAKMPAMKGLLSEFGNKPITIETMIAHFKDVHAKATENRPQIMPKQFDFSQSTQNNVQQPIARPQSAPTNSYPTLPEFKPYQYQPQSFQNQQQNQFLQQAQHNQPQQQTTPTQPIQSPTPKQPENRNFQLPNSNSTRSNSTLSTNSTARSSSQASQKKHSFSRVESLQKIHAIKRANMQIQRERLQNIQNGVYNSISRMNSRNNSLSQDFQKSFDSASTLKNSLQSQNSLSNVKMSQVNAFNGRSSISSQSSNNLTNMR